MAFLNDDKQWNIIQPLKEIKFWYMFQHGQTLRHYAKWSKSDTKGQTCYDSTYIRYRD